MGKIGWLEIVLIAVLVLILFGHSKIPELAKNLAGGINVFKKELKGKDKKESGIRKEICCKKAREKEKIKPRRLAGFLFIVRQLLSKHFNIFLWDNESF